MATVYLKPIAGVVVQYPGTKAALPAEGAEVALDNYWRRRINDGSVVVVAKAEPAAKTEEKETTAEEPTGYHKPRRG